MILSAFYRSTGLTITMIGLLVTVGLIFQAAWAPYLGAGVTIIGSLLIKDANKMYNLQHGHPADTKPPLTTIEKRINRTIVICTILILIVLLVNKFA